MHSMNTVEPKFNALLCDCGFSSYSSTGI